MQLTKEPSSATGKVAYWLFAAILIIALMVLVGTIVQLAYDRGLNPAQAFAGLIVAGGGLLATLHLVRWLSRRILKRKGIPAAGTDAEEGYLRTEVIKALEWDPSASLARAEAAIQAGKLWRAKQILAGNVGSQPYHPALYEAYGRLLLRMGDDIEAGKYLLLSGATDPSVQGPIELFLKQQQKASPGHRWGQLPARARSAATLPPMVARRMDHSPVQRSEIARQDGSSSRSSWLDSATGVYVVLVIGFMFVAGVVVFLGATSAFLDWAREQVR